MTTPREFIRVPSNVVQKWIVLAKKGDNRMWTAYGAHEIEQILWDYSIIPQGARYRDFDAKNEEVIFVIPSYEESRLPPKWKRHRFINWLRQKLT